MVNSSLYCSGVKNCIPGRASSARMSNAIKPAHRKKNSAVTRYILPIVLWSVVRSSAASARRRARRSIGGWDVGRLMVAVMIGLPAAALD